AMVVAGDIRGAAMVATESEAFYDVALPDFFFRSANNDNFAYPDLNDYTATLIGFVRDDYDFREIFMADRFYRSDDLLSGISPLLDGDGFQTKNDHYRNLGIRVERGVYSLSNPAHLFEAQQTVDLGHTFEVAGVLTTRGFAEEFYRA